MKTRKEAYDEFYVKYFKTELNPANRIVLGAHLEHAFTAGWLAALNNK